MPTRLEDRAIDSMEPVPRWGSPLPRGHCNISQDLTDMTCASDVCCDMSQIDAANVTASSAVHESGDRRCLNDLSGFLNAEVARVAGKTDAGIIAVNGSGEHGGKENGARRASGAAGHAPRSPSANSRSSTIEGTVVQRGGTAKLMPEVARDVAILVARVNELEAMADAAADRETVVALSVEAAGENAVRCEREISARLDAALERVIALEGRVQAMGVLEKDAGDASRDGDAAARTDALEATVARMEAEARERDAGIRAALERIAELEHRGRQMEARSEGWFSRWRRARRERRDAKRAGGGGAVPLE